MTIDPRVSFWFCVVLAVLGFLVGAGAEFADLGFSPATVKAILAADSLILGVGNAVNAVLHAIPSKPGATTEFYLGPKGEKQ